MIPDVKNTTKILISCDTGIDDALALGYMLGQRDKELVGVAASYGMAAIADTYRNTRHILGLLGSAVPVAVGSGAPLYRPGRDYNQPSMFHGSDGLGGFLGPSAGPEGRPEAAGTPGPGSSAGYEFILEAANRYGKDLAIVTTGPFTDLARALLADPALPEKVGAVVSMAGALATPGNVNEFAEANVNLDVDAAKIVLESALPFVMIGLDVTRKTLLRRADLERWQDIDTGLARLLSAAAGFYLDAYARRYPYLSGCALHDPLAIGAALHPEWFTFIPMHLTAVTEGACRGRTCEDLNRCGDTGYTGFGAFGVDAAAFEQDFFAKIDYTFRKGS